MGGGRSTGPEVTQGRARPKGVARGERGGGGGGLTQACGVGGVGGRCGMRDPPPRRGGALGGWKGTPAHVVHFGFARPHQPPPPPLPILRFPSNHRQTVPPSLSASPSASPPPWQPGRAPSQMHCQMNGVHISGEGVCNGGLGGSF